MNPTLVKILEELRLDCLDKGLLALADELAGVLNGPPACEQPCEYGMMCDCYENGEADGLAQTNTEAYDEGYAAGVEAAKETQ